jgi:hypothetical protein
MPDHATARSTRKQIAGYFEPEVARALRRLAMDRDTTQQALLAEALNDLFVKHGMARLADETPLPRGGAALKARGPTPPNAKRT